MKNVIKMLLVSAALVVASPAWAAPGLAGSATPIEQGSIGLTSPSTPTQIAIALKGQPKYAAKDFSLAEIEAVLRSANGWNSNQVIPLNYRFSIPLPVEAPAAKPEPIAVTKEEAPVAQAAVKPLVEPSAELRKTQADLQSAKQEQSRLKAEVAAIAARTSNATARSINTQLSPEDRAKVDQLLNVNKVVKDLEAVAKRLTKAEADIATLKTDVGKKANSSDLNDLGIRVAALEKAPPVTEAGWTWYDWAVAGLSVLGALASLLAVYVVFFRKVDVRTAVNNALQTAGLSQTVFRAELDELKGEVEKLSTDVADSAKDHKQVQLPTDLEEQLKALDEGKSIEIVGTISGNRGLISFTKSGDNFVTTTDIDKQTQPMNIEKISKHGCGIRSTLLRHIGAGRVKLRPIAQAVNS